MEVALEIGNQVSTIRDFSTTTVNKPFQNRQRKLEWQNDFQVSADHKIVSAWTTLSQHVNYDDGFGAINKSRRDNAGFVGYVAKFAGGHHLQINLRQDRYSDVGDRTTGLIGGGFALSDQFR